MVRREILLTDLRPVFDDLRTVPGPPLPWRGGSQNCIVFRALTHHEFTQQHTDGFCLVYQLG